MSTHRNIDRICVAVLLVTLLLTILFMNGEKLGIQKIVDEDAEQNSDSVYFTEADLDGDWDASEAAVIHLDGEETSVEGSGAYACDGGVVITNAGRYILSGTLEDGSITVSAYASSKVWLCLAGVDVTCLDSAALIVEEADKVFVTLAEGTENFLTGGEEYSAEAAAEGIDGAVFAKDDLTINGSGMLTVEGGYRHGIAANDDLVITGGTIKITAAGDAVHVNDSIRITDADITAEAGDDGLAADNEGAWICLASGTFTIRAEDEGIAAPGDITVAGGTFSVSVGTGQGAHGIKAGGTCSIEDGTIEILSCFEGIQAAYIDISGGELTIYPSDDGLNASTGGSSGFMGMGGEMGRPAGMDTAPEASSQEGGEMSSPEESDAGMDPSGGTAAESGGMPAMPDEDRGEALLSSSSDTAGTEDSRDEEEIPRLHISGGSITVINEHSQDADGLDSNGDIIITGGTIRVSLTGSGSNSALDYGSENGGICQISGGDVIACGSYSMAEGFDSSSTQCSILYNFSAGTEAGTLLVLEDADRNVLLEYEVPCSFTSANISCPDLETGETYYVVIGDSEEEITITETAASYGDARSTMFGGSMNWGGMKEKGGSGGGQGRMGQRPEGDAGGMPQMGEMPEGSGVPGESVQSGSGELPEGDAGGMPQMGEMPEGGAGMPDFGEMPEEGGRMPGDFAGDADPEAAAAEEEAAAEDVSFPEGTFLWLGLSFLVLAAGLAAAFAFRRHR